MLVRLGDDRKLIIVGKNVIVESDNNISSLMVEVPKVDGSNHRIRL